MGRTARTVRWLTTLCAALLLVPMGAWLLEPLAVLQPPSADPARVLGILYVLTDPLVEFGGYSLEWLRVASYAAAVATSFIGITVVLAVVWRGELTAAKRQLSAGILAFVAFEALAMFLGRGLPFELGATARAFTGGLAVACFGAGIGTIIRFAATFPRPLPESAIVAGVKPTDRTLAVWSLRVCRSVWLAPALAAAYVAALLTTRGEPVGGGSIMFVPYSWGLLLVWFAPYVLVRAAARAATEAEQRQLLWINAGFVGGVWTVLLLAIPPFAFALFGDTGAAAYNVVLFVVVPHATAFVIAGGLVLAVLYRGAVDPAVVIRRTTVYGMLGILLVFLFAGVENLVADVLAARLGWPSTLGGWIAGGTAALAFGPLREWLQVRVRKRLPAAPTETNP